MRLHISTHNSKLGNIHNISLPPITTCCIPLPCVSDCYALRAYNRWGNVRKAWDANYEMLIRDKYRYWSGIQDYIESNKPKYFRFHIGGDILNQDYFDWMKELAGTCYTKFLVFTKNYELDFDAPIPQNLTIILSTWPGLELPKTTLPIAFMQNGSEDRVIDAIECKKKCDRCFSCWGIKSNVVFKKH